MSNWIVSKFKNQIIRLKEWRDTYVFDKYKKKLVIPFDSIVFSGKRVALVGGACTAIEEKNGDYIDKFDLVVRVNQGINIIDKYKDYVGTKTDFLFHSLGDNRTELSGGSEVDVTLWHKSGVKDVVYVFNTELSDYNRMILKSFLYSTKYEYSISEIASEDYLRCRQELKNASPTTGFIALSSILNSDFSELFITGFSFFKTPHTPDYRDGSLEHWRKHFVEEDVNHNPDFELQFLINKLLEFNDDRIKFDKGLHKILIKELGPQ